MGLRLEIISRHRQAMRASAIKEFGPDGGTIGRSLQTDWPLPDAQRFLSSRHAAIDFRSGSYYIVDTSTNGVFINDSTTPVGKGKPQRLFTGDVIRIGEYEIRVEVDTLENTAETLYDDNHVDPVEARQRVESPDPTGHDLIDAFEITGVGLEIMLDEGEADTLTPLAYSFETTDLELEDSPARPVQKSKKAQKATSAQQPAPSASAKRAAAVKSAPASTAATKAPTATKPHTAAKPAPTAKASATTDATKAPAETKRRAATQPAAAATQAAAAKAPLAAKSAPAKPPGQPATAPRQAAAGKSAPAVGAGTLSGLIEAFCNGAGIDPAVVRNEDPRQVMRRLGETFGAMLAGITDSLRLRSLQKAELRQAQTVIQDSNNNLLKFSVNANEAMTRLLAPQTGQYMDPVESVRDAFADLNAHQRAALKVLPKVLNRYLQQLDPDELESRFAQTSRNPLLGAANRLRYWDLYRDVYLVMSQQAEDELPEALTDMLSAAFEEEIDRNRAASDAAIIARKAG